LPVDRTVPLLTLTVFAAFASEASVGADGARGEPERHLVEREHRATALAFIGE